MARPPFRRAVRRAVPGAAFAVLLAAAYPAAADWRQDHPVIRIGLVAGLNPTLRRVEAEPFRAYLQARLSQPVELVMTADYRALVDAQVNSFVHMSFLSAAAFTAASASCGCVEPLAVPTAASGATGFHAVLAVRADGPIRSLADMRGARLAVTGADSVAGRLVPMQAFAEAGLGETDFARVLETGSPEQAMAALLAGEADAALAWSSLRGEAAAGYSDGVLAKMVADGTLDMGSIRLAWTSPLIPYGPAAVRSALPEELKDALRRALLGVADMDPAALDAIDRSGGGGFAVIDTAAYAPLLPLVTAR